MKHKLKAFLHDPIDKAFNIQFHRKKAEEYAKIFCMDDLENEQTRTLDQLASAADRINLPQHVIVDFNKQAELTHPLGSGKIELANPEYGYITPNYSEIESLLKQVFEQIVAEANNDVKLILLSLWRNLTEYLRKFEIEKFKLGNLWNLMPADTRIPDHTILDHNWLSSAMAGSLPNPAFLKFSFGPIQNFVLASKRTEDYWAGSFILSYLCSSAMEVIIERHGPEHIIFPYINEQPLIDKILREKYSVKCSSNYSIKIPSLSNVIFAVLPYEKSKETAEQMKKTLKNTFSDIGKDVRNEFESFFPKDDKIDTLWEEQINDFLEVYYCIYPWPDKVEKIKQDYSIIFQKKPKTFTGKYPINIGNYWQEMYKILETAFNSRKNLRTFTQVREKTTFSKCSMCGEREILTKSNINQPSELKQFWKQIGESSKSCYKIDRDGRDRLCAVCFTKRMAGEYYFKKQVFPKGEQTSFPSTSTIATLPLKIKIIKNIDNPKISCFVDRYNKLMKSLNIQMTFNWAEIEYLSKFAKNDVCKEFLSFDGQWLFEENFTERSLRHYDVDTIQHKETIKEIKECIWDICKIIEDKPSKYYAIISMDGDHMGKWLSGTHENWPLWRDVVHSKVLSTTGKDALMQQKRVLSPALHKFISRTLSYFSLVLVRAIVEKEFPGKLVYSGGDDVVAFVPVEYALPLAEKIRFTFSGNLNKQGEIDLNHTNGYILFGKDLIPTMGNNATMSAGIAIVHKNYDLREALNTAKKAEKEAKKLLERDSFVVKVIKGSGNIVSFGSKWRENNSRPIKNILEILQFVADESEKQELSMSFFQSFFYELEKLPHINTTLIDSIMHLELKRHLQLKKNIDESIVQFAERKKKFIKKIEDRFSFFINNTNDNTKLSSLLLLLRFLATGGKR